MNKPIKLTFLLMLACLMLLPVNAQNTPEWQSQYAVGLNKLAPHTYVWPYASATDVKKGDYEQSPYYLNLNGKWKFHWVKNPDLRPKDFYKPSFYTGGWADINVPGNWERQGYGTAIYVNETYEFDDKMFNFKKNPPLVPYKENEVGSYRRTFTVPAGWKGRRVVLCCEGVISFYYVWVNGHFLGYNQGSKTAAEWDITDQLEEGENTIALEVYRWSSGSYLECQDMWRLSGIERDVYLYSTPKQYIADYKVNATLEKERYKDGIFGLDVTVVDRLSATDSVIKLMDEGKIDYIVYTGKTDLESINDFIRLHHHAILLGITVLTALDTANALADIIASKFTEDNTELVDINHLRKEKLQLSFTKMQSCGNDYIYFDNRDGKITCPESIAINYVNIH